MKITYTNALLLISCFGIAFEFRKVINEQPIFSNMNDEQHSTKVINRKDWLKSDQRRQMEIVALNQGWVQYVDGITKKRFWYCASTNESFFDLVFVGSESIRLNRWCRKEEDENNKNPLLEKGYQHKYIPPPSSLLKNIESNFENSIEKTLKRTQEVSSKTLEGIEHEMSPFVNKENELLLLSKGTMDINQVENVLNEEMFSFGEKSPSLMGKPKPVKGRHTKGKGKRRAIKKVPERFVRMAEEKRLGTKNPSFEEEEDNEKEQSLVEEEIYNNENPSFIDKSEEVNDTLVRRPEKDEKSFQVERRRLLEDEDRPLRSWKFPMEDMPQASPPPLPPPPPRKRPDSDSDANDPLLVPPTAEEAQGGSGRSGRQRRHRKRAPYQDFPTKGGSSNEGQGSIGPGVGEVGKRLPRNRRNRPAGPAPLSDSELLESDSSGPEMNITTDSTKLAQDMINVASASKNSKQSSRIPFFMHLHKAAGTTICELAERNKKRAAGMGDDAAEHLGFNCNLRGDDPGHLGLGVKGQESTYGQAEGKFSCEARANILQKNSLQFTAIERWIFPAEICPSKFIYMTCFRDPISRIKSAVKFHKRQTEKVIMKWATENAFNRLAPISTGSPSVDNYYVRSFGGPKVFRKKLGTITRDDLLVATNVFSKFEIVLILEHFDRDLLQLKTKLGWKINNLGRAKSTPGKHCDFTPDQTAQLKSLNVFDYELYNFANSVAEELSKKAMFLVKMRQSA